MKRIICLILALLLLCPTAFAAKEDLSLVFSKASGKVGDEVTFTVSTKGAPVTCSFKVILTYDKALLQPIKIEKIDTRGMFMSNTDMEYQGKPAINALSVDANKVFEGDSDLYSATFKILKAPASGNEITLDVAYTEFYDYDIKALTPAIGKCVISVETDATAPDSNAPDAPETVPDEDPTPEDGGSSEEQPGAPESGSDSSTPGQDQPAQPNAPETQKPQEEPKEEDDAVTGEWFVDKGMEDIAHSNEDGTIDEYKGSFVYDEENKVTKVELTDEEGNPAGELIVEENEAGVLTVVAQKLLKDQASTLPWLLITIGAVVLAGGIAVLIIFINKKRKSKEN